MKKSIIYPFIMATGIKKRCRKLERHYLKLPYFDINASDSEILDAAKRELSNSMKSINGAYVVIKNATIENDSGMEILSYCLTGDASERRISIQ
jgi:hypothetical protein